MSLEEHAAAQPSGPPAWHAAPLVVLAVSHPVAEVLVRGAEFFVAYDLTRAPLLALGFWLFAGLPAAVWVVAAGVRRLHRKTGEWLSFGIVASLSATLWARGLSGFANDSTVLPVAAALGVTAAVLHWHVPVLRVFVAFLAPAPAAAAFLFFTAPPVATLMRNPPPTPSRAAAGGQTPVVMLVFDQLPLLSLLDGLGQIDREHFPNFAALADDATWYRNVTAASDLTTWALPALLTGRVPAPERLPSAVHQPDNLFSLLAPTHRLNVVEPIAALCGPPLCSTSADTTAKHWISLASDLLIVYGHLLLPPALAGRWLPPLTSGWRGFGLDIWQDRWVTRRSGDRQRAVLDWVDRISPDEPATLHFIHVLLPHEPFIHLPTGQLAAPPVMPGLTPQGNWLDNGRLAALNYARHLLQVQFVDHLLGLLLQRLRATGLYQDALLVVVADHGAAFRPGLPFRQPTDETLADVAGIPFLLKLPRQRTARMVDWPLQAIDVLPTLALVLGVEVPWTMDGKPAENPAQPPTRHIYLDRARQPLPIASGSFERSLIEAIRWKQALLDSDLAAVAGHAVDNDGLVGKELTAVSAGARSPLEVLLDDAATFALVRLEGTFVPTFLSGTVRRAGRPPGDTVRLAIAINGTVRSITETVRESVLGRRDFWAALVPPQAFRDGSNEVSIFEMVRDGGEVELRRTAEDRGAAAPPNLLDWAVLASHGATAEGFYDPEYADEVGFRWTNGSAVILLPIDPIEPPQAIDVTVLLHGPRRPILEVRSNDCVLFRGRLVGVPWTRRLPLAECLEPEAAHLRLAFLNDTFVPDSEDRRTLGVALQSVFLIPARPRAVGSGRR